jgi:hypothetical protein
MGLRLLLAVAIVVLCTSSAFAGPQLVISDPLCTGSEINLGAGSYSFTYNGQASLTFCNTTSSTFTDLNFTISASSAFDLSGFYCGAPDAYQTAAFDYCLVLDPNQANAGNNSQLYGGNLGVNPQELVLHQFVTSYPKSTFPFIPLQHDGPTKFYQQNNCFFGCQTNNVGSVTDDTVHLSFNLLNPLQLRPELCLASIALPTVPCGLLPGHQFTLTFACDPANTDTRNPCTSLPDGAGVALVGNTSPNQVTFPTPVPEPTSLILMASAGIPALLRRRRKT